MQRLINTLTPVRNWKWARGVKAFIQEQAERGVFLSGRDTPVMLSGVNTVVVDAELVMEGWNAVRMAAAPLAACDLEKFRRQGSWMMLTAGVALGCDGYAPLEAFAAEHNFERERMAKQYPKVEEIAYDDARRMETTVHRDADGLRAYAKGDPDALLARCALVLDGRERPMTDEDRLKAAGAARHMEAMGLETLAFATRWLEAPGAYEEEMVFLGVVGMGDLPSIEAQGAMGAFHEQGIRTVLISDGMIPEGAVRASGALRPGAGILRAPSIALLEGAELRDAVRDADAYLEVSGSLRGLVLRALRAESTVARIAAKQGGVTISVGREDGVEASIDRGGIEEAAALLASCRALVEEYRDFA